MIFFFYFKIKVKLQMRIHSCYNTFEFSLLSFLKIKVYMKERKGMVFHVKVGNVSRHSPKWDTCILSL